MFGALACLTQRIYVNAVSYMFKATYLFLLVLDPQLASVPVEFLVAKNGAPS